MRYVSLRRGWCEICKCWHHQSYEGSWEQIVDKWAIKAAKKMAERIDKEFSEALLNDIHK